MVCLFLLKASSTDLDPALFVTPIGPWFWLEE
jgi:hypothetical protein